MPKKTDKADSICTQLGNGFYLSSVKSQCQGTFRSMTNVTKAKEIACME